MLECFQLTPDCFQLTPDCFQLTSDCFQLGQRGRRGVQGSLLGRFRRRQVSLEGACALAERQKLRLELRCVRLGSKLELR